MQTLIVVFAFGAPAQLWPNRQLAKIAARLAAENHTHIYRQWDVTVGNSVRLTSELPGRPPSTLELARGAMEWASEREVRQVIVVAAKPHIKRCVHDLELAAHELKFHTQVVIALECLRAEHDEDWFWPSSDQWRTRSPKVWWLRETILRVLWLVPPLYKRVAG